MPEKAGRSLGDEDLAHNRDLFSNARSWQSGIRRVNLDRCFGPYSARRRNIPEFFLSGKANRPIANRFWGAETVHLERGRGCLLLLAT